jgi:transposase
MHITYNLENDPELADENIRFITGLTHSQIQTLIAEETLQLSLFSSELAEVVVDDKRYILSVNPDLEWKERTLVGEPCRTILNDRRERCDALVAEVRKARLLSEVEIWANRCVRNEENRQKQEEQGKGKYKHPVAEPSRSIKTELNEKDIKGYTRRAEQVIDECGMNKYCSVELIDNQSFTIIFNQDEFDKSLSLCGKYVVYSNVPVQDMTAVEVRGEYKNLQNVERDFRDLKSDNISLRPVYHGSTALTNHMNENQTRGHVLLCMFALAIIKELENKLYPFLKEYNKKNKTKLSFDDLKAELNNIKMCELKIGEGITSIMHPDLNPLQKKILQVLNINPDKMNM